MQELPSTANLPVLGLSNKATSDGTDDSPTVFLDNLTTPPLEDHLSRYTLSPELDKIYAHPSEIIALATSHSGTYIASTCKSSTSENAVIRIFDTSTQYSPIAVLPAHSLTVTKLAWSPDDKYLVSVGRDRQWSLFDTQTWQTLQVQKKAHARIIWDVSFAPREFGAVFVTASRDKTVKVWAGDNGIWDCVATVKFSEAVTACGFCGDVVVGMGIVAVGLEDGRIYLVGGGVGARGDGWMVLGEVDVDMTHSEAVTGLAWRPRSREEPGGRELASCGDDCSVRIYGFKDSLF